MSTNKNTKDDINRYRDYSRYSSGAKNKRNEINLGSHEYSRHSHVDSAPLKLSTKEVGYVPDSIRASQNASQNKTDNRSYNSYSYTANAPNESNFQAAKYSRTSERKYSHARLKKNKIKKRKKRVFGLIITAAILIVLAVGVYKLYPIKINIGNQEITLTYDKTLKEAINQSNITVQPGNFVAVDNSILQKGKGETDYKAINGEQTTDENKKLKDGDIVEYKNGLDIMEEYNSIDKNIIANATIKGTGSIHKFEGTGEPGVWSQMTGKISGIYAERQTKEPSDITCNNYNANPGSDKVIALTFDDGPSDEYTQQILDLLSQYNAKATFFVIGENLQENWGKKLVAKEDAEGHQVCTHTYDHARKTGGTDITSMSAEDQIKEVTKGQEMITKALGKQCSTVCRLPGGNIDADTLRLIGQYVSAEIGWNLDTGDWQEPGVAKISKALDSASTGDIILCHDGGGDRSQTIEALEKFLKEYSEKGYKFITIDEMMNYPAATQNDSNSKKSYSGGSKYSNDYGSSYDDSYKDTYGSTSQN